MLGSTNRKQQVQWIELILKFLPSTCIGQTAKVTRTAWWAAHYEALTPKRHYGYSNSPVVSQLDRGQLAGWRMRDKALKVSTTQTYQNSAGKTCYKGTKQLRGTESPGLSKSLWLSLVCLVELPQPFGQVLC